MTNGRYSGCVVIHARRCPRASRLFIPQRVQLGMALNYAEKMKAEAPTPRQTLVHELVSEFGMPLRTLGFNDRRDAGFRWIAQSLQTILDSRPFLKRSTFTTAQQTAWLKDTAPLDPAWKKRVHHTYKVLVDTLTAHPNCLKVTHGPATIAPIDLVMMVLLVFEFQDKLSVSRLADALHALRMAARDKTKDLMWKSEHMGHYLVFLDRLERIGEAALSPSNAKDAPVPMDVDPPAKRQRTGGAFLLSFERMHWQCSPNVIDYAPVSSSPAQPQRTAASLSLKKPELQPPHGSSSSTVPRPMVLVPPSPSIPSSGSGPVSVSSPNSPFASTAPSKNLAAIESMLATFASRPSNKVDRLAAVRAAKAAMQSGQSQSQLSSHPLPPRPTQTPVVPRQTVNTDWPVSPIGGSAFGSSGILGGGPSGSGGANGGGGGRK